MLYVFTFGRERYACPKGTIYQDLFIYIKIYIYTSRLYIHQDLLIYTSKFTYMHQDVFIYIKIYIYIYIYISRFSKVQLVVYYQCCILIGGAATKLYVIVH